MIEKQTHVCNNVKGVIWKCTFVLQLWNETYLHFHKVDPKQTYYLSMEYLQGRALTNAIGNLDLKGPYADALRKLGYELEEIAEQVLWDTDKFFLISPLELFELLCFGNSRRKMQLWEMVVWGDSPRASWIPWPPSTCLLGVMVWGTDMACLSNLSQRKAKKRSLRTGLR